MGVRGLSTFFDNNPNLSQSFKLCNTTVIIDGNNLIHLLYFRNKVDCVYGGDYNRYASAVRKYLSSYIACDIKPLVVFDGGYDKSDRKFKTVLQRNKTRLTLTQHIARYGDCAGNVLPINAIEVFKHVLEEMAISYAQCDFEADEQVTALANHYKCPVLSDDSDFYIFDITGGFIRLSSVDTSVCEETADDGTQIKYLKCSIYYIDKFLSYFPGIDKHVLPLFGTLVGNDFVNTKDFETFFSNIQLPKTKYKGLKINLRQRKIIGILSWLKDYNINEGISQVLCRLKKDRRERVKLIIEQSVHGYETEACNLINILNGNVNLCKNELLLTSKLISPCGTSLPIEFVIAFHQGRLPSFFLNVINLHRVFLPAQVENICDDSSFLCSRPVRQVLYGILLQHESSNPELHIKYCLRNIKEYDRRSGSVQCVTVEPIFKLQNSHNLPQLHELYSIDENYRRDLLIKVIRCDENVFSTIPDDLKLLIGSINYWLSNSKPGPTEEFVYSLILSLLHFNVLQKINFSDTVNKKNDNGDSDNICSLIDNISLSDAQFAAKNFKKYLQKPILNHGNPLILHIVHSYSQLQTCILSFSYLNLLFSCPFKRMKLHETLCGTMIYNLTKEMLSRPFPELFVSELLGRTSILIKLFHKLKSKIFMNIHPDCLIKTDRSLLRRKKISAHKGKKISIKPEFEQTVDCNKLETLCTIDGDIDIYL